MTMTYHELWRRLTHVYGEGEAKAVARMLYEVRYGLTFADLCMGREADLPSDELELLARRLESAEPVQYVLGEAVFCGRSFAVNPHVLIPRPETEDLCHWVCRSLAVAPTTLLDIGTGSGCIAVTLAAEFPQSAVTAWDLSAEALGVAAGNADRAGVSVRFAQVDALRAADDAQPAVWDVIVSNPPYICQCEAAQMERNVLDYEPHTALFVPDDDPLLFYRAIGRYARTALTAGGMLFLETNPLYVDGVANSLSELGFSVSQRDDSYGKTRFVRGIVA